MYVMVLFLVLNGTNVLLLFVEAYVVIVITTNFTFHMDDLVMAALTMIAQIL